MRSRQRNGRLHTGKRPSLDRALQGSLSEVSSLVAPPVREYPRRCSHGGPHWITAVLGAGLSPTFNGVSHDVASSTFAQTLQSRVFMVDWSKTLSTFWCVTP